ncbi:MAG: zinc dependent phospholipase C family protein [Nitrospinae bacterium]|nr:zinc dependent phospholipase C family protein [Nitrospinota bacterium]
MAGTFTHWMVVEEALKKISATGLQPSLTDYKDFVLLGAVSPDLPYLTDALPNAVAKMHNWADRMHYEKIDGFIFTGFNKLSELFKPGSENYNVAMAWLFGYVAHVITDVVVHPVVNAIVGPYIFNSTEHRVCEMTQDVLVFAEINGGKDLSKEGYHLFIRNCSRAPKDNPYMNANQIRPAIKTLWSAILKENHLEDGEKNAKRLPKYLTSINPDTWFENYRNGIGTAQTPNFVTRHLLSAANLAYPLLSKMGAAERKKYYDVVSMPKGHKPEKFFDVVFTEAVDEVKNAWEKIYADLSGAKPGDKMKAGAYIRNWNLDLGVDMNDAYMW